MFFLQHPIETFPIELHINVPFLHILLPRPRFDQFLIRIGKSFATGDYMNLLSEKDILFLLKEANLNPRMQFKLIRNKILGFACTFSAIVTHDS